MVSWKDTTFTGFIHLENELVPQPFTLQRRSRLDALVMGLFIHFVEVNKLSIFKTHFGLIIMSKKNEVRYANMHNILVKSFQCFSKRE